MAIRQKFIDLQAFKLVLLDWVVPRYLLLGIQGAKDIINTVRIIYVCFFLIRFNLVWAVLARVPFNIGMGYLQALGLGLE